MSNTLLGREPALWIAAFRAVLITLVLFGLDLSEAQVGGILLAAEAVLALLTRSQVVPNVDVVERKTTAEKVVAGPGNERVTEGTEIRSVDH